MSSENAIQSILTKIPPEIVESFTEDERLALWSAAKPVSWRRQPVNIRITFPFLGQRYFVTMVAGYERRAHDRLKRERVMHPLRTAGNILFMLGVGGAFYLAAVLGIFIFSSLIEF